MNTPNDRRRALAHVALLAALLGACAVPEKLNSDRIRDRFGNYGVEIVSQDAERRRSSLYSTADGMRTARTEALVVFQNPHTETIAAAHEAIVAGGSVGETFRGEGWKVLKKTAHIGEVRIEDASSAVAGRMGLTVAGALAMHVYELHLEKDAEHVFYATVVEIHHPDYLTVQELLGIYPVDTTRRLEPGDVDTLAALVLEDD